MFTDHDHSLDGQRTVVVGGGILGTTHALFALARGAHVVHLERDLVPHGATVRNFGLIWVSGRAEGAELELALRARTLWQEISDVRARRGFSRQRFPYVAEQRRRDAVAERAVARDDAVAREFELLSHDEVLERNPALAGKFETGLYCGRDAAVESRVALGALRDWMAGTGRYEYYPGRELVGIADYEVD